MAYYPIQCSNDCVHCCLCVFVSGSLHIKNDPDKMSKSLRNNITVDELLSKYTANQFRVFCLLTSYGNSKS